MKNDSPGYAHTQNAPLCLIRYGSAVACFAFARTIGKTPDIFVLGGAGLLVAS